eukprot:g29708.t1
MKQSKTADKDTSLSDTFKLSMLSLSRMPAAWCHLPRQPQNAPVPSVTAADIRSVFLGVNPRIVRGPDGVPSQALCVGQLADVLTDIFNLSLLQAEDPCSKKPIIIPVPKKVHAMCLNDYRPLALTAIIMKCFKSLPTCLSCLQFSYQCNRSTAISLALHSFLEHVDSKDTYVRLPLCLQYHYGLQSDLQTTRP